MRLDRRSFFRGAVGASSVAIALPALEIMLSSHGDALANGFPLPDRFGVWFWGNGVRPEQWVPSGTGTSWSPSVELAPLAASRDYVSVVTGCEIKTATHPHHSGMTGIMTGQAYHQLGTTRDTIVSTFARQSVDQDAADWFDGQAPFRSLEFGVTKFYGTDEGSTFQHLSHNGPNNPNPSEMDPGVMFQRLFAGPSDPQINDVRRSVLDHATGQVGRLQKRLGTNDRLRLDQHLDSIRTLETRIASFTNSCDPGTAAPVAVADVGGQEQVAEKTAIMADLLALALSCDLTRAFSVQFSTCGSGVVFWQVGAVDGLHLTGHTEAMPQPIVHAATVFTMEQLGVFLDRLRLTPEGSGNLLDRCSILCTSELSDGYTHANNEFPILVCGKGNGRLRGGIHYRSPSSENTSKAVLTALRGAGVELPSWGVDDGLVTDDLGELLA